MLVVETGGKKLVGRILEGAAVEVGVEVVEWHC